MKSITIQFESDQAHQTEAMDSIVELFDGLFHTTSEYTLGDDINPNIPPYYQFDAGWLKENLSRIRDRNQLGTTLGIEQDSGFMLEGISSDTWSYPVFTVLAGPAG